MLIDKIQFIMYNTQKKEQFFTDFETNYAAAITAAKDGWAQMQSQLQPTDAQ